VSLFIYWHLVLAFNDPREIIRDNMLINMSGVDDQWMGVDMNIEHLTNFLKVIVLNAHDQCVYLFAFRRYSPRRGFTRRGTASVIFRLQAMSCALPRSTSDGS